MIPLQVLEAENEWLGRLHVAAPENVYHSIAEWPWFYPVGYS